MDLREAGEKLISTFVQFHLRIRQIIFMRWEDLHRAGFELGDFRLRAEWVVC